VQPAAPQLNVQGASGAATLCWPMPNPTPDSLFYYRQTEKFLFQPILNAYF